MSYAARTLVNVIRAQTAAHIAVSAGLTDVRGFCPINGVDTASTIDPKIFVGDDAAMAGDMPKSALAVNNQAKIVAAALRAAPLVDEKIAAHCANTCWGQIYRDDYWRFAGRYDSINNRIIEVDSGRPKLEDRAKERHANMDDSTCRHVTITQDMFRAT